MHHKMMSPQTSALLDSRKMKSFLSNWRWSTVSENSSAAPPALPPTEVVWVVVVFFIFFIFCFKSPRIPPRAGGSPLMTHSADLKFGFAGVEEMEVWEQPCITAPANVLQYFSSSNRSHRGSISAHWKVFVPVNDIANGIILKKG